MDVSAPAPKLEIKKADCRGGSRRSERLSAPAELKSDLAPADLLIELDKAAGRFVNTLVDSETQEVILRYPNETQLAFSRAVERLSARHKELGGAANAERCVRRPEAACKIVYASSISVNSLLTI
ncbi:MAG: hypothetical protein WDM79_08045 [Terricaulis sp.]